MSKYEVRVFSENGGGWATLGRFRDFKSALSMRDRIAKHIIGGSVECWDTATGQRVC